MPAEITAHEAPARALAFAVTDEEGDANNRRDGRVRGGMKPGALR